MNTDVSSIKYQVSSSLKKILEELAGLEVEPEVVVQTDLNKGDFSSNVALSSFAQIKNNKLNLKSPMELANEIVRLLNTEYQIPNTFRLVEAKSPGFINFWLSEKEIIAGVKRALLDKSSSSQKTEMILEFGDLNPFKEPHIGHLRNLALGESLARLMEFSGIKVIRANYEGDVGAHVAKAIWAIVNSKLQIAKIDEKNLEDKIKFLAECYAKGAKAYEENEKAKAEIISINNKIYSKDSALYEIWEKGRAWSLEYFETLYKTLGIKYDKYYFESKTAVVGLKIVTENTPRVFERHGGALVFRGEKFGLHTRVFVTKENYATYEGKDLALAALKDKDFPKVDCSIIMTANEQIEYFKVMLAALKMVNEKIAAKTSHLSFGFVNLREGKMSSRTGNVVSAFWLIEETKKRLKKGFKQVSDDVLEQLAVGSVKWGMLKFSRESNIAFSIDESVQIEGNSGPYMQYAYARTQSLLEKSSKPLAEAKLRENLDPELLALMRLICQFKIVASDSGKNFSPNSLSNYLYSLAQNFNQYYEKERVIGSDKEEEKLVVVKAVGEVLKKGLYLLGIASPNKI